MWRSGCAKNLLVEVFETIVEKTQLFGKIFLLSDSYSLLNALVVNFKNLLHWDGICETAVGFHRLLRWQKNFSSKLCFNLGVLPWTSVVTSICCSLPNLSGVCYVVSVIAQACNQRWGEELEYLREPCPKHLGTYVFLPIVESHFFLSGRGPFPNNLEKNDPQYSLSHKNFDNPVSYCPSENNG